MGKDDANKIVEDLRAIFSASAFEKFRDLIVRSGKNQNGKSIAPISQEALSEAFAGVTLNEDQQALVDITVNTINSNDVHKIKYVSYSGKFSRSVSVDFAEYYDTPAININAVIEEKRWYSRFFRLQITRRGADDTAKAWNIFPCFQ